MDFSSWKKKKKKKEKVCVCVYTHTLDVQFLLKEKFLEAIFFQVHLDAVTSKWTFFFFFFFFKFIYLTPPQSRDVMHHDQVDTCFNG